MHGLFDHYIFGRIIWFEQLRLLLSITETTECSLRRSKFYDILTSKPPRVWSHNFSQLSRKLSGYRFSEKPAFSDQLFGTLNWAFRDSRSLLDASWTIKSPDEAHPEILILQMPALQLRPVHHKQKHIMSVNHVSHMRMSCQNDRTEANSPLHRYVRQL